MNSVVKKAMELENLFYLAIIKKNYPNVAQRDVAKVCALIAIDEIMSIVESYENALSVSQQSDELIFWKDVRQEIIKL